MYKIEEGTLEVVNSEGFYSISQETLAFVLSSDRLRIDELKLIEAYCDWARQKAESDDEIDIEVHMQHNYLWIKANRNGISANQGQELTDQSFESLVDSNLLLNGSTDWAGTHNPVNFAQHNAQPDSY